MTDRDTRAPLDVARRDAGLSMDDLWLRYITLGGQAAPADMATFVTGAQPPRRRDHDLLAQALNERFIELDRDMPVPYFEQI